ncbi:response regulator [Confluentibacter flavum]|uniref:Response regulator n=1 Tax=Confluentibacter flavum TaxID=1909700 RepID=A0A2N3HNB5_9FLAO|nr:response regulator [Confluentibacter flavum]PKQ46446.1 response regulator [Confluentibacter flavum]
MTKSAKQFILVDDDSLSTSISKMVLVKSLEDIEVKDFIDPEIALEYIETQFENKFENQLIILLLDINMPNLTGWEFLDKFKTFTDSIKKQFEIYMLSSSVDPVDIQRAKLNPLVKDFIEKPLNKAVLLKILG